MLLYDDDLGDVENDEDDSEVGIGDPSLLIPQNARFSRSDGSSIGTLIFFSAFFRVGDNPSLVSGPILKPRQKRTSSVIGRNDLTPEAAASRGITQFDPTHRLHNTVQSTK